MKHAYPPWVLNGMQGPTNNPPVQQPQDQEGRTHGSQPWHTQFPSYDGHMLPQPRAAPPPVLDARAEPALSLLRLLQARWSSSGFPFRKAPLAQSSNGKPSEARSRSAWKKKLFFNLRIVAWGLRSSHLSTMEGTSTASLRFGCLQRRRLVSMLPAGRA